MGPNAETLKQAGLKVTHPRLQILQLLRREEGVHWRVEDLTRALRQSGVEVSVATAYRVVAQFEQAGLVRRQQLSPDSVVYEFSGPHHDHMVCLSCGRIEEFVDAVIEERQKQLAKAKGFLMHDHTLTIHGICSDCQQS